MVSIRYFCGVGEFTWWKSRPRGCFASNNGRAADKNRGRGKTRPMAANACRKSRREIRRFMQSKVSRSHTHAHWSGRWMPRQASTSRSAHTLEDELQSELNEPRIVQLATRDSESRTISLAAS